MKKIKVGEISVDAGIVWIGDPCYIMHKNIDGIPRDIGRTWEEFCDILSDKEGDNSFAQFSHDKGFGGLGVCVSSGYGDGVYDVMAEIENDRVKSISVKFF